MKNNCNRVPLAFAQGLMRRSDGMFDSRGRGQGALGKPLNALHARLGPSFMSSMSKPVAVPIDPCSGGQEGPWQSPGNSREEAVTVPFDARSGGQGALGGRPCGLDGVGGAQRVHGALVAVVHQARPLGHLGA